MDFQKMSNFELMQFLRRLHPEAPQVAQELILRALGFTQQKEDKAGS